eukprot:CAMPEP_0184691644 /NCGR_PEP_ID=MMETSP0313-20130426/430_1 /TAXON_ID=2792 /ORGANISM="Porphyridium aerugineum, Strain SAG 1380-2" /LENGTH=115 /DNA_ID=CAMNT_0027149397 /DNA_START=128 /DNA_END=475 /DNA_ORIENTATION=-
MEKKSTETIQTLLDAEKEAALVVEKARKERDARLKKAVAEAEAEISAYRAAREKEYLAEVEKFEGSSGVDKSRIAAESDERIKLIEKTAEKNRGAVSSMLVDLVMNVDIHSATRK